MIADFLNVSFPKDTSDTVTDELALFLSGIGGYLERAGLYRLSISKGSISIKYRSGVMCLGVSGAALRYMREFSPSTLGEFLMLIGSYPHRVTSVDIAHDVQVRSAPDVIAAVYDRAREGRVRFTKKFVKPGRCRVNLGPNEVGRDTGTVYIGQMGKAEVFAKVYDKRWELVCKGHKATHEMVRYELTITGKMGVTLHDVYSPDAAFWHFAGVTLLESPVDVPDWVPNAEGFQMGERVEILPYQRLKTRVYASAELEELGRLADYLGPEGHEMLISMLRRRWKLERPAGALRSMSSLSSGSPESPLSSEAG